jgi:hypothetical protein
MSRIRSLPASECRTAEALGWIMLWLWLSTYNNQGIVAMGLREHRLSTLQAIRGGLTSHFDLFQVSENDLRDVT